MRRWNKLLKSGTSLVLVLAMLMGMCTSAFATGETVANETNYVSLGDSMANGYGLDGALSYPELFANAMGYNHAPHAYDGMRVEDLRTALVENAALQADVANADVISLGIGNADFGVYAVNSILSVLGVEIPGAEFVDVSGMTLENAMAECNDVTRELAVQLYDELKALIVEQLTDKENVDQEKVNQILDVMAYIVINYMNNYIGVIDEIAAANQKDELKLMIVGLVNVMDDLKVDIGREIPNVGDLEIGTGTVLNVGKLMYWATTAMDAFLATLPATMQLTGKYENVTFVYASDVDVELMYTQFGEDGVSRALLIEQICADLFPLLGDGFAVTVPVSLDALGDLNALPGLGEVEDTIDMTVTIVPEAVTVAEVEKYEAYIAGKTEEVGMTVNKMYSCALCKAFEDAICGSNDLGVVSVETLTELTAGLDSIFAELTATLKSNVMAEVNDELIKTALSGYENWAKNGEGKAIADAILEQMIKDTVASQKVVYEGKEYTVAGLYALMLTTVVDEANKAADLGLEGFEESDVDWDALYASLIADYETDDACEAAAREIFEAHLAEMKEILIATAIEVGKAEAKELATAEARKALKEKLAEELPAQIRAAMEAEIEAAVRAKMPGMPEALIEAAVAEAIAKAEPTIQAAIAEATTDAALETAVDQLLEDEEYKAAFDAAVDAAIEEKMSLIEAMAKSEVEKTMNTLWAKVWEEALSTLYTEFKAKYDQAQEDNEELMESAWLLPLSLLVEDLDDTDPMKNYQAIVSDVVLTPVAKATATVVTNSLAAGLTEEPLKTVMYLFGRTLLGDGLGYHPSANGHKEIANAMLAKLESGEDVHDDLLAHTKTLIDLLNKYGPKVLKNAATYDKLNAALDKLAAKLEGRVDNSVLVAIDKAKAAVDKIEDIIIGGEELSSKAVISAMKTALKNLDKAVEEIFALIGQDVPADIQAAMDEFQADYLRATSGVYNLYDNSYYVAIGDKFIEGENSYTALLNAELKDKGLLEDYKNLSSASIEESIAALLDAEVAAEVERADLITIGFSNNSMFDFMATQIQAEIKPFVEPAVLDWETVIGKEGAKYVKEALVQIEKALIYEGLDAPINVMGLEVDALKLLMVAIESYAYAAVSYTVNYPVLIEKIREVNPYALIISVGMSNTAYDINLDLNGSEFNMGNYIEYMVEIANAEALAYAMIGENIVFVEAPDVDILADEDTYDAIGAFAVEALTGSFSGLYASDEGHEYIKTQILNALEITELEILGDVNFDGVVNGTDTNLIFRYVAGVYEFSERQLKVADVNHDGVVNGTDTNLVFRFVAEVLPYLGAPVE